MSDLQQEICTASLNAYREHLAEKALEQKALMTKLLYGDSRKYTQLEKLKHRMSVHIQRLSDAWEVFRGHAEIREWD